MKTPLKQATAPTTTATPAVAADPWPEQNRRRLVLIDKKYAGGLTSEEQAEYERLQAVAREVISAHVPPLMFTPEERAFLESKAAPR